MLCILLVNLSPRYQFRILSPPFIPLLFYELTSFRQCLSLGRRQYNRCIAHRGYFTKYLITYKTTTKKKENVVDKTFILRPKNISQRFFASLDNIGTLLNKMDVKKCTVSKHNSLHPRAHFDPHNPHNQFKNIIGYVVTNFTRSL